MEKKAIGRIKYLDIAKGVLIVLLVFAHFRSAVNRIPYDSHYFEMVYGWNNIFTCFYMPAFFIISGYCSNYKKTFGTFLISLVKSLLIPLIAFTLIDQAAISLINRTNYLEQLWRHVMNGGGLWFLQAMIIGKLILYGMRRINGDWGGYIFVCLLLLCIGVFMNQWNIGPNPFSYKHALIASFWLAVGQWLKEKPVIYERAIDKSIYVYPIVAVATFFKCPSFTASISISMLTIPLHIIYAFVGTMFLLKICTVVKDCKVLEYWGKNSLVVYALHFTPLLFLTQKLWEWMMPDNIWLFLLFFVILYSLEYTICWILMKLFNVKPLCYTIGKF